VGRAQHTTSDWRIDFRPAAVLGTATSSWADVQHPQSIEEVAMELLIRRASCGFVGAPEDRVTFIGSLG
jgi:hypothetical protein